MITAILVGDREVIARLTEIRGKSLQGVARAVTRLGLEMERLVKQKLSGEVLNVRTGVLRSSINTQVKQSATEVTATVGTNVKYARAHEFGVPHSWEIRPVKARALAFQVNGQSIFAMRVTHPPLPERSFLRSALREMTPRIRAELEAAVGDVIHNRAA
jgi:phage gpG-like protein